MHSILQKLEGGDRRSIGKSNEVVKHVLADPGLFGEVFAGMLSENPLVAMRAADAIEKITLRRADLLRRYKAVLIKQVALTDQKEVRWHVAQLLPRIQWHASDRRQVVLLLMDYLNDHSVIVKTFAMQALADLTRQDPRLRPSVLACLRKFTATGTAAMKARGRKLVAELGESNERSTRSVRRRAA